MRSGNYKETYSQLLAMTDSRLVMFATLVLIMALIAFPFMVNTYVLSFGVMICIMAIGVLGLTFEAIRNCGDDLTRECFIAKMEEIKDFDTGGLMGPVSFGKGVRFTNQQVRMIMSDVANKKFVPLTDF